MVDAVLLGGAVVRDEDEFSAREKERGPLLMIEVAVLEGAVLVLAGSVTNAELVEFAVGRGTEADPAVCDVKLPVGTGGNGTVPLDDSVLLYDGKVPSKAEPHVTVYRFPAASEQYVDSESALQLPEHRGYVPLAGEDALLDVPVAIGDTDVPVDSPMVVLLGKAELFDDG
ncbi:hypothetical protein LTR85_010932 [Meristemomyces frigidus]|nr:hypothetical protein LTR85_010932 [Meristemomyces frigidus]